MSLLLTHREEESPQGWSLQLIPPSHCFPGQGLHLVTWDDKHCHWHFQIQLRSNHISSWPDSLFPHKKCAAKNTQAIFLIQKLRSMTKNIFFFFFFLLSPVNPDTAHFQVKKPLFIKIKNNESSTKKQIVICYPASWFNGHKYTWKNEMYVWLQ